MRKKIFEIVEVRNNNNKLSKIYDVFMFITIIVSIIPLGFKTYYPEFVWIDCITVTIFIVDYILRLITADFKLKGKGKTAFIIYPFTPMALIDLFSILPFITLLNNGFQFVRLVRLLRTLRVMRAFKILRYSRSFIIITNVFKKQKKVLFAVVAFAVAYILLMALVILNAEPETFESYFEAVYWATISLTTVGYGDIYPISAIGKLVAIISSFFGVAIIALPAGIITGGYLEEIRKEK